METSVDPSVELLLQFDPSFDPPQECGNERCRDFFPEFIYIVVIPASVTLLFLIILLFSLLTCCLVNRKKKRATANEDQLASYDAVRRASISIRRMSTSNSTPLLDGASRSGSMTLARTDNRRRGFRPRDSCHSAPGTLQRHHRNRPDSASLQDTPPPAPAPPPYGVPQQYPLADEEEAFLGPEIPMQELQAGDQAEAAHNDPHQQPGRHHHHHRHHRRQRPYSAANGYTTH